MRQSRRQVTEDTPDERIAAEVWARVRRTDRAVGSGMEGRIRDAVTPRR
jgi:hypothetical protein